MSWCVLLWSAAPAEGVGGRELWAAKEAKAIVVFEKTVLERRRGSASMALAFLGPR